MVLQAKAGAAIWNKDLLERNRLVPVIFGSFFVVIVLERDRGSALCLRAKPAF